ncbi:MAG: tyrosine-type recombinase/integrase [Nakamurella sp.]
MVETKRFDTERQARAWEQRRRASFDATGFDPANGKVKVSDLLPEWAEARRGKVSPTTSATDRYMAAALPVWISKLNVGAVNRAHIEKLQSDLLARGLASTSVKRYREGLSAFFAWSVREGYVVRNPVAQAAPVKDQRPNEGIRPLNEGELEEVATAVAARDQALAMIVRVLAWTGIRWGEARAMRVRDFVRLPTPLLHVMRNQPESLKEARTTKSGRSRRVPVADAVLVIVEQFASGKSPDDLLFTTKRGAQLHRGRFVRTTDWANTGQGRTLHDLRHTAACLWLMKGVPLGTVQAWMGHADVATTNRYLHHLGDYADRAGLALLNGRGDYGVTDVQKEDTG